MTRKKYYKNTYRFAHKKYALAESRSFRKMGYKTKVYGKKGNYKLYIKPKRR